MKILIIYFHKYALASRFFNDKISSPSNLLFLMSQRKIAVVLFNLGGPSGPETIRPFLVNFFMDPNIIPWPKPLRFFLAHFIAWSRSKGAARDSYGEMGGSSPILENTLAQQNALQESLKDLGDVRVYTCMRYWHPMAESVVPQVQAFNPDELMLVSLYPQMSSTTFWSSLTTWQSVARALGYTKKPSVLCCYPTEDGFIGASTRLVREAIERCRQATGKLPRVLFSAHSLPVSVINKGDPYQHQCEMTVQAILARLNIPELDYVTCYQSKVGPSKWLGPQTEDEIRRAGHDKVPLIIYPHAFVCEHVETIVELGIEYKEVAHEEHVPYYDVVPTVGTAPEFITGLDRQIRQKLGQQGIFSEKADGACLCPGQFSWCCQRRAQAENILNKPVAGKCCQA
jgi:protoporphyrin/coproporphyrin ferrochelatase